MAERLAWDVAIVGGSFAGLTAALQLGRASRSVVVIDAGRPRNARSPAAHGVPGWDGRSPEDILSAIRADVSAYPTVQLRQGSVTAIAGDADTGFALATAEVEELLARRVILAFGMTDRLPAIPGLTEGWGRWVLHCPYCHGYEVRGRPLAVIARDASALHVARMLRTDWSDDVTLLPHEADLDADALAEAHATGVGVEPRMILAARPEADGVTLDLAGGGRLDAAAVFVMPRAVFASPLAEALGLATDPGHGGPYLRTGPFGQTSRPGIFAAGDILRPAPAITPALADGVMAGTACHQSLIWPDRFPPAMEHPT